MSNPHTWDHSSVIALYDQRAAADRAARRLCEAGIAEDDIRVLQGSGLAGGAPVGGLDQIDVPEGDLRAYEEGLSRGGTVVIVAAVAPDLALRALEILDDESVDLDETRADDREQHGHAAP